MLGLVFWDMYIKEKWWPQPKETLKPMSSLAQGTCSLAKLPLGIAAQNFYHCVYSETRMFLCCSAQTLEEPCKKAPSDSPNQYRLRREGEGHLEPESSSFLPSRTPDPIRAAYVTCPGPRPGSHLPPPAWQSHMSSLFQRGIRHECTSGPQGRQAAEKQPLTMGPVLAG